LPGERLANAVAEVDDDVAVASAFDVVVGAGVDGWANAGTADSATPSAMDRSGRMVILL
jgi:hypothetical protein